MAASRAGRPEPEDLHLAGLSFTVPGAGDVAVRAGRESIDLGVHVEAIVQRGGMYLLIAEGGAAWLVPPSTVRAVEPLPPGAPSWT